MKIVVDTMTTRDYLGEEEAFRCIRAAGFDGVDYSFFSNDPALNMLGDDYRQQAYRTKERLAQEGLFCRQTHAPFDMQYGYGFHEGQPEYLAIVRAIEYASILGAEYIVVHGIKTPRVGEMVEYNARFFQSLVPYCARFGIRICVENLVTSTFYSPELLNDMMECLDPQYFTICLDVGHTNLQKGTPADFIRAIGINRISALHVHDNDGKADLHELPFIGTVDWETVADALASVNYNGDLTLEVLTFLLRFPAELQESALRLCAETARYLANRISVRKNEN